MDLSLQLGSYVSYKSTAYIAVQYVPETKLVTILNPVDGINKLNVKYSNVTVLPYTPAKVIEYKDAKYLVTGKGLIISLATKRPMKWKPTNGNRICILSLAGVIEQQHSNGEEEFVGDIAGYQDASETPEHSDFLSTGVDLEEGVDTGEDLEDMLNEVSFKDRGCSVAPIMSEPYGLKDGKFSVGDSVKYTGIPLLFASTWLVEDISWKTPLELEATITTKIWDCRRNGNAYERTHRRVVDVTQLTKLEPCADCGKGFTDKECEEGALHEVSEITFPKSDKGFKEVHGYKMVCESCYCNNHEVQVMKNINVHNPNAKQYPDGTPAIKMSIDGWSRGFDVSQTLDEMTAMGVEITKEQILTHWKVIDGAYTRTQCGG